MLFTADNIIHSKTHNGFACSGNIKAREQLSRSVNHVSLEDLNLTENFWKGFNPPTNFARVYVSQSLKFSPR